MSSNRQLNIRSLAAGFAVAAATMLCAMPSYAGLLDNVQLPGGRHYNSGGGYRYGRSASFSGTASRIDNGDRSFRLYTNNGQSYHVDARNSSMPGLGSLRNLPDGAPVSVQGYFDSRGNIVANQVLFQNRGYNGGGYNNYPYNNGGYNNYPYNNGGYNNYPYNGGHNGDRYRRDNDGDRDDRRRRDNDGDRDDRGRRNNNGNWNNNGRRNGNNGSNGYGHTWNRNGDSDHDGD